MDAPDPIADKIVCDIVIWSASTCDSTLYFSTLYSQKTLAKPIGEESQAVLSNTSNQRKLNALTSSRVTNRTRNKPLNPYKCTVLRKQSNEFR